MKTTFKAVAVVALAYHLMAIMKDADRCMANWQRFQAERTPENLLRFVAADGVLAKDILSL